MRIIPKCGELLDFLWQTELDDAIRIKTGGDLLPRDARTCKTAFDSQYNGLDAVLLGVQSDSGEIVGAYFVEAIDHRNHRCLIHVEFKQGHERISGASWEVVKKYLRDTLEIERVFAEIAVDNPHALEYAKRQGFCELSVLPSYYRRGRNRFVDGALLYLELI